MIGVLLVTHGEIGTALLTSASQILGGAPHQVATLSVWRHDDPDDLVLRARELLEQLDAGDGVLVLTDIFGATPGNVASRLLDDGHVEGVSGVSLPMPGCPLSGGLVAGPRPPAAPAPGRLHDHAADRAGLLSAVPDRPQGR